jgi:SNF2 family DNA or RNA helicase
MTEQQTLEAPSEWPEGALYYSPRGLYPFQTEHVARAYLSMLDGAQAEWMFSWDTGLGKSHAAMQIAALAFEDRTADFVLLVCEKNKLLEWKADFERFTKLTVRIHHGPSRKVKLDREALPDVLITTYETGKADLVAVDKSGRRKVLKDGNLLERVRQTRPMVFFDEADKLSNRTSATYKAYDHSLKALRQVFKNLPTIMMTATSIRKDYENAFNQLRLLRPQSMPLVKEFESYFVRGRDIYGKARYWDHRTEEFAAICQPLMLAKSKTDPDVIDQFPTMTEEALWVELDADQRKLYDLVAEFDGVGGQLQALRQICANPKAIIHSAHEGSSKLAKGLLEELGMEYFLGLSSAKTDALGSYLEPVVLDQEDKAMVFTFFGPSVIPWLKIDLMERGLKTFTLEELDDFRAHRGGAVLLSSDAGARGINVPEASYLVEYDMAVTYGLRTQRLNRVSRIGSGGPSVTVRSMLARRTVEVGLMFSMLRGNVQSDELLGRGVTGEEYMSASMRKALLTEDMGS